MRLKQKIELLRPFRKTDSEGFGISVLEPFWSCRAYVEQKHVSERWVNLSRISDASLRVVLRWPIRTVKIEPSDLVRIDGKDYEIDSINDVAFRHRYLELYLKEVSPHGQGTNHTSR